MSKIEITYCDICKKSTESNVKMSYIHFQERDENFQIIYDERMDICIDCFKKYILPLKKEKNNV